MKIINLDQTPDAWGFVVFLAKHIASRRPGYAVWLRLDDNLLALQIASFDNKPPGFCTGVYWEVDHYEIKA